jgi:hypothetical protein
MRIGSRIKGLPAGAISSWTDDRVKARADWLRSVGEFRNSEVGPVGRYALTSTKVHAGTKLYRIADKALCRSWYPEDTKLVHEVSPADT